jgi:UDP-N-acetylmuramate dehydrogenase
MLTEENISLKPYNTFGLNYIADRIIHLHDDSDIRSVAKEIHSYKPYLILGGGSNLLFTGDFKGTLIHPVIGGIRILKHDNNSVIISAGSGIRWDDLVAWTVENGFYGLENLSLIPGNTGAAPVQNIGAYGVEVRRTIDRVETIRLADGKQVIFSNDDCGFDYRYSIFKGPEKGNYIVTRVFFRLSIEAELNLEYGGVKEEVLKLGETSLKNVRSAIIRIRKNKLPDPNVTGNAGSFFKNPVVPDTIAEKLRMEFPLMPQYPERKGFTKLAAGWLIQQCGLKGKRSGDAGVHENQALVLVNYGNATGKDIYSLSETVRQSVKDKFGLDLEREVEIVGSI